MSTNELYLAVLPLVHISVNQVMGFGLTEQTLTLLPSKDLATRFHPDDVDRFLETFKSRANKYLSGGHVLKYEFEKESAEAGGVIVRVIQHVDF